MGVLAVFEPRGTDNGARTWYHPTIHELKMMNTIALFGDEEHDGDDDFDDNHTNGWLTWYGNGTNQTFIN